jgi:hypothetical protein
MLYRNYKGGEIMAKITGKNGGSIDIDISALLNVDISGLDEVEKADKKINKLAKDAEKVTTAFGKVGKKLDGLGGAGFADKIG